MISIMGDWKSDNHSAWLKPPKQLKKIIFIIAISYDITITPIIYRVCNKITQAMKSFDKSLEGVWGRF